MPTSAIQKKLNSLPHASNSIDGTHSATGGRTTYTRGTQSQATALLVRNCEQIISNHGIGSSFIELTSGADTATSTAIKLTDLKMDGTTRWGAGPTFPHIQGWTIKGGGIKIDASNAGDLYGLKLIDLMFNARSYGIDLVPPAGGSSSVRSATLQNLFFRNPGSFCVKGVFDRLMADNLELLNPTLPLGTNPAAFFDFQGYGASNWVTRLHCEMECPSGSAMVRFKGNTNVTKWNFFANHLEPNGNWPSGNAMLIVDKGTLNTDWLFPKAAYPVKMYNGAVIIGQALEALNSGGTFVDTPESWAACYIDADSSGCKVYNRGTKVVG